MNALHDDFSKSFMFSLHQMGFLVQKRLEQVLSKEKSISFSQFLVLVTFRWTNEVSVSQATIAERLHLTEATISRHVATLVAQGFLSRAEDKANRRKHVITITNKGNHAFEIAAGFVHRELEKIFSPISEADRKRIIKNFTTVIQNLRTKK